MEQENRPNHIAIILDGNRRWAKSKGLDPKLGHKEGAKNIEKIVRYANQIGLPYISAYVFSTENWKRTEEEVGALMLLLKNYLEDYGKRADTENIRVKILGHIEGMPKEMQKSLLNCMERTKNNTGTTFCMAINYGGRDELVRATRAISQKVKEGYITPEDITEDMISKELYTKDIPDPDLVIRTSGELRTSNFLPWQIVYSELLFVGKNWPDFTEEDLEDAIKEYQKRTRKFGGK